MVDVGFVLMGIGVGFGKFWVKEVVMVVIFFFLLEFFIQGVKGVVFNVIGGIDLILYEVNVVVEIIYEVVDVDVNIIFGVVIDDCLQGEMRIIVIVMGFNGEKEKF